MSTSFHIKAPWIKEKKSLNKDLLGLGVQQVIATIKTEDGLKIADVYDTAIPDINAANVSLVQSAPQMFKVLEICLSQLEFDVSPKESGPLKELIKLTLASARGQ